MRYIATLFLLASSHLIFSQGNGFTFNYTGPTQIIVGPDCEEPLLWGHPNTPTVQSNIPGGMIVSFEIFSISGGYDMGDQVPGGTTVTVFYQAIDNFGNNSLFGFSINFIDVLPPVFDPWTLPQPNLTINCVSNLPPPADVEATDNCESGNVNLTITYTQTNNAQLCTGGTVIRKWVADDDLGNLATFTQTINVTPDNTPPVITNNLVNGSSPCSTAVAQYTTWLNTQRMNFTATDAGCGLMTKTDNAPAPNTISGSCGDIVVTFTATDNCANSSTVQRTFSITNNVPPSITTPASGSSGNCGQNNIAAIFNTWINTHGGAMATDDCSNIIWSTYPPNPSIYDTCDASIPVMFIASDGCNNSDTTMASFVLIDDTGPSILVPASTSLVSCTATNLDSVLMNWLVTGGISIGRDLCTRDTDLTIQYEIANTFYTLEEVLMIWEDSLNAGCRDNVFINGIGVNNVKAMIDIEFNWTDNCNNSTGTRGIFGITDNGRPTFVTLPRDTSFACASGGDWEDVFMNWYNTAGNATIMDGCSEIEITSNITADSAITYLSNALDTACDEGVSVTIQFTLTDDCGNVSMVQPSATFQLSDTLDPVFVFLASDLQLICDGNAQGQLETWLNNVGGATAMDGCGVLTWEFQWDDGTGIQTGIPNQGPYPNIGASGCSTALDVFFIATDGCQNSVVDTASVSLQDTVGPVFSGLVDTLILNCTDTIPEEPPGVTDNCDPDPSITFEEQVSAGTCSGSPSEVMRIWIATDACQNESRDTVWYFRSDNEAPTFTLSDPSIESCNPDSLFLENVVDNCDPDPQVTFVDELTGEACGQTLTRIWTVTDACGNVATAEQVVNLEDNTPPAIDQSPGHFVFSCHPENPDVQVTYDSWRQNVSISDDCSASSWFIAVPGSYTLNDTMSWPGTPIPDIISIECGMSFTIPGHLVVYDDCGNAMVDSISFSVRDTVPPLFENCPDVIEFPVDTGCTGLASLIVPSYIEICNPEDVLLSYTLDGGDTINILPGAIIDTILSTGPHFVEWFATDCAGLIGECYSEIRIVSEDDIQLTCPDNQVLYTAADSCTITTEVTTPLIVSGECALGVDSVYGFISTGEFHLEFAFPLLPDTLSIELPVGSHMINLVVSDKGGDVDTCRYSVMVLDTIAPEIVCQSDSILIAGSGLDTVFVNAEILGLQITEACSLDTVEFSPSFLTCSDANADVLITSTVIDASGNTTSCVSTFYIQTTPLEPSYIRGLCEDTLRLFTNNPDTTAQLYIFSWTGPEGFISDLEDPVIPEADTSHSGIYTVTITSSNGCVSTGSIEVVIDELNTPVINSSVDTACVVQTVILTSNQFGGNVTYNWYQQRPEGDTLLSSTLEPTFEIIFEQSGTYVFYASASQDTCDSGPGSSIEIVIVNAPAAAIANIPLTYCVDDTLFLSPVVVIGAFTYEWTGPSGYSSDSPTPAGIPVSELNDTSVFYLRVSNAFCTSDADSIEIIKQTPPSAATITGTEIVCEGGELMLNASGEPGDEFLWIDPMGNILGENSSSISIPNADESLEGEWKVVILRNGCPGDTSAGFGVMVDTSFAIQITSPDTYCEGDSITLSISPTILGDYAWSGPGGFTSVTTSPVTLSIEGIYTITVSTNSGCDAMAELNVSVNEIPELLSIELPETCVDGNSPIVLTAISDPLFDPSYTYNWSGSATFQIVDSTIVFDAMNSSVNGEYTLFIANGNCNSDTIAVQVNVVDGPSAPTIDGDVLYCEGDTIQLNISAPIDATTYTWITPAGVLEIPAPGHLTVIGGQAGLYSVFVTNGECSSDTSSVTIEIMSALPPAIILNSGIGCEGDSIRFDANVPQGSTIQWTGPNGFTSTENEPLIYPLSADDIGEYFVTYSIGECVSALSDPFFLDIQSTVAPPALTQTGTALCIQQESPITFCIDESSLVSNASYIWYLDNNQLISGPAADSCLLFEGSALSPGIHFISAVTSVRGCLSDTSSTISFQADAVPNEESNAGDDVTICPDDIIFLNAVQPQVGTGNWSSDSPLVVFDDSTSPSTTVGDLSTGSYTLTWSLSAGACIDYASDDVLVQVLTTPITVADTFSVPFGQTQEFIVVLNDTLNSQSFTLNVFTSTKFGNALHAGNGVFRYTPNVGFVGTDTLVYQICSTECPDECDQAVVILRVGDEDDCFIPTLFTPNADGINDRLIVPCLETSRYPNNRIIVYNEWGNQVYEAAPYLNNWEGTYKGDDLPVGTYFYIMDFGDGSQPKRSFLVLER